MRLISLEIMTRLFCDDHELRYWTDRAPVRSRSFYFGARGYQLIQCRMIKPTTHYIIIVIIIIIIIQLYNTEVNPSVQ